MYQSNSFNPNFQQNMNMNPMNNNMFSNNNQYNMNSNNMNMMQLYLMFMNNMIMNNMNMNNMMMNNMNNMNMNNMNMNNMNMNNMMMNNMMMNNMMMNNMNNNMNMNNMPSQNSSFQNINNNGNNNKSGEPTPIIERVNEDKVVKIDIENSNRNDIINVNLHASSGLKVMMAISQNKTIADLISLYGQRIGINKKYLGNEIIFIFNAETLDINDSRLLKEKFSNLSVITVVDQNNVIGA